MDTFYQKNTHTKGQQMTLRKELETILCDSRICKRKDQEALLFRLIDTLAKRADMHDSAVMVACVVLKEDYILTKALRTEI